MCIRDRTYEWKNLSKDLLAGLVIMAVSIPISMGYAQIAGLPAVYGPVSYTHLDVYKRQPSDHESENFPVRL